jgi:UDP-N-acetylglucosamine 2-epimerase (non-hydrolysing)/GDP/UDP-N,N'-diacetylbacillosamine 2-epimerase (hydrolysing)
MAIPQVSRRRICVVSTTRADYGLLYWLMKAIQDDPDLELSVVATGMHLVPEFGMTVDDIEAGGFTIDKRVEILISSDSRSAIVKSMGVAMIAFADALKDIAPDIVVILGDRFEIVPVALASVVLRIPLAHIHGGETSQGALDEAFRHAVTKLANVHFPATEIYRRRILQMGEEPGRTFNLGAPGLDALYHLDLLNREQLQSAIDFRLDNPLAIVTYHPVTLERETASTQIDNLMKVIAASGIRAIFTKANADAGGRGINRQIGEFCRKHPERFKLLDSLGRIRYLSCLKHVEVMIGNSSSGLTEAPSFGLPVVNIGDRQKGRVKAANIIDAGYSVDEIHKAIVKAISPNFKKSLAGMTNPYEKYRDGKTSQRIKEILKIIELSDSIFVKTFRDLNLRGIE